MNNQVKKQSNPLIALTAQIDDERDTALLYPYVNAIESAGGIPIIVPYIGDNALDALVSACDGFFFTGGADVNPEQYGERKKDECGKIQKYRDALEISLLSKALKADKPILGVCRGAQLINVALGGTLYQDIPSEIETQINHRQKEPKFSPSHNVKIFSDTPLYTLIGNECMSANSFHHQAIKTLGEGLKVMAIADDGIIEALTSTKATYLRMYQWHPERLFLRDENNRRLFLDFVNACK